MFDPAPEMTLRHLERQGQKQDALDEAYECLSAGLLNALLTDPDAVVQRVEYPATAAEIVFDSKFHLTLGPALQRVVVEMLMEQYRAGDPRALWAVDAIVHDYADFWADELAADLVSHEEC